MGTAIKMWQMDKIDYDKFAKIILTSFKIKSQARFARAKDSIVVEPAGEKFEFLAPQEIMESLTHTWEPYDNIAATIADKYKSASEALSLARSAWKNKLDLLGNKTEVPYTRIDTPLVYSNSERRKIEMSFQIPVFDNPKQIMDNINKIRELSSPSRSGANADDDVELKPPYVWTIMDGKGNFITIDYAALETVQATYKGPYTYGDGGNFFSSVDLNLGFQELRPVFDEIYSGKVKAEVIKVTETGAK